MTNDTHAAAASAVSRLALAVIRIPHPARLGRYCSHHGFFPELVVGCCRGTEIVTVGGSVAADRHDPPRAPTG